MKWRGPLGRYLLGAFCARLAEDGMAVAVALLALARTGNAAIAAAIMAAWLAPHIIAAPLMGGVVAGRRRPALLFAVCLLGFAVAIALLTTLLGRAGLLPLLLVAVAGGCLGPVVSGGLSSMVPNLVAPDHMSRAYALDAAVYNAASVSGPAVVTALAALVSPAASGYWLAAAAALAGIAVSTLPSAGDAAVARPRLIRSVVAGISVIWSNRVLRGITVATCLAFLGMGALPVTAVLLAGDDGGLLITGFALGAMAAAVTLARWTPPISARAVAGASLLVTGFALPLAALAPSTGWCLAAFIVAGAGDGPLLSATFRLRARHAPERLRTQVFTTGAAVKLTAAAAGSALVAAVGHLPAGLLVAAIGGLCLTGFTALWTILPVTSR